MKKKEQLHAAITSEFFLALLCKETMLCICSFSIKNIYGKIVEIKVRMHGWMDELSTSISFSKVPGSSVQQIKVFS